MDVRFNPLGTSDEIGSDMSIEEVSVSLALNFPQFSRILIKQTNLSAALCAIRVAERGVGLQPTFYLDQNLAQLRLPRKAAGQAVELETWQ
jgi:hypothetical protein